MSSGNKLKVAPLWLSVILLLLIVGAVFLFTDLAPWERAPEREPEPPSTEWTTEPEGGIEVDLPETPMRIVPRDEAAPLDEAATQVEEGQSHEQ